ncbi:hypothetical protein WR25_04555 isoform A [Diploscapter pachys]|uniref:F-box domain-containing protein n=1 Tax=Diploscapter pachys TaxID=2018661 RepID=A0A2A2J271_9BILA|nr:hypothetical protein WR25_04555 isoform A [Diploscapter pachys]
MLNGYPVELLEAIFYYLPISDLVETAKVNRRLNAVIGNKNNRSGKRLSGKNRVSIFVHFYDNLYRNNSSHGMYFTHVAELRHLELNDPNIWRPKMLFITTCCNRHNSLTSNYQEVLDNVWHPITDEEFFRLNLEDIPNNNELGLDGIEQGFWSKAAAIQRLKRMLFYLFMDYGVVSSISITNITNETWNMLCDIFENHHMVRCKPSINLTEIPKDIDKFFSSPLFLKGIDTLGIFDSEHDVPYYELCAHPKVQTAQNLQLRKGIGITDVSLPRLKCNTLYAKFPKMSKDGLKIFLKAIHDKRQGSVRSYLFDMGKFIDLYDIACLLPESSTKFVSDKEMDLVNKFNEQFVIRLSDSCCELAIKSVRSSVTVQNDLNSSLRALAL